jgi:hypothetical protein
MQLGHDCRGRYAVEVSDPAVWFLVAVDDSVAVTADRPSEDCPTLRGDATQVLEALSLRTPRPPAAPPEWERLIGVLAAVFDA